ncbi:MAG: hypothetical protein GT598_00155 [Bacteroidales bacterium]|jgi:hypothetical protein|nr:hypothetical protein [Bacteroidales bacterium]HQG76368.1 hypothetical protein [Bacteroidales bacterium]
MRRGTIIKTASRMSEKGRPEHLHDTLEFTWGIIPVQTVSLKFIQGIKLI